MSAGRYNHSARDSAILVLGMIIGVLADRFPRNGIMAGADIVRFGALASVPLLSFTGMLAMWHLYAVSLVTGIASAFFGIAYQAYLPVIVLSESLTAVFFVSSVGNPAIG